MIVPKSLGRGDRVAIVSPASAVKPEYIDGAARFFEAEGFEPVVMPHAKGPADGSYAAADADRLADLTAAYADPSVRAILCARGGYGCNHLLPHIDPVLVSADPKWLIGFSDVSALHVLSQHAGVVSLHSPMAKHLTELPPDHYCTRALMRILTGGLPVEYSTAPHPLNRPGQATGRLVGGNLAVINGLAATPFDPLTTGNVSLRLAPGNVAPDNVAHPVVLFIEDIGEQIYEVERMLLRLKMAGRLDSLAGLIVGHFTDYRPDRNHADMYHMISGTVGGDFPVAFGFPAGHTDDNLPLPLGANVTLTVTPTATTLKFA